MKINDLAITQKSVDDFFDSIDTEALADSIKLLYPSNEEVENMGTYQEYLKTKENIESITDDLEMDDDMIKRARKNLLHEFEQTCQAAKCYETSVALQQQYLQRSYAFEDALEQLEVHYGTLTALRKAINQVDWEESSNNNGQVRYVPVYIGENFMKRQSNKEYLVKHYATIASRIRTAQLICFDFSLVLIGISLFLQELTRRYFILAGCFISIVSTILDIVNSKYKQKARALLDRKSIL